MNESIQINQSNKTFSRFVAKVKLDDDNGNDDDDYDSGDGLVY